MLPRTSYCLVSHLVEGVPTEDSYNLIKEALMQAHQLSDYQRVELLSKVELLGARKPSDLLAAMIELCPRQHLDSPFFLYFFLQRLLCEICVLLAEEDPKGVRRIAEKADRQPASSDEDTAEVAAVKQCSHHRGGKKWGKGGKQKQDNQQSTLCWYHTEKAQSCTAPCSWAEN
jgi:hypothetical protein